MLVYYDTSKCRMAEQKDTMTRLSKYVQRVMQERNWSYRTAAEALDVSRQVISDLVNDTAEPTMETMQKLARKLNLPLWMVVQMSGIDLELPTSPDERTERLQSLTATLPEYQLIVDHLLDLDPDDADGILIFLEGLAQRRVRKSGADSAGS